jgi:lysophospholipase L1-like esterase
MQLLLKQIAEKWSIKVIDLWEDETFNAITPEQRALYLADAIHPTQAGYRDWWTPYMEPVLYEAIGQ